MNLGILEDYFNRGLLMKQVHPTYDLTIWNYTRKTQYGRLWDEVTLNCRGLVTNSKGEIVARPFKKFFNWEQLLYETETRCDVCNEQGLRHCGYPEECQSWVTTPKIPNERYEIFHKMDGCLGILFHYNNEWILASRASFTSAMSQKGRKILEKYRMILLSDKSVDKAIGYRNINDYTFICEIIYDEARIVVDYKGREDVVLLGMINKNDGNELSYDIVSSVASILNMPVVNKVDINYSFEQLKSMVPDNFEGYVIRFESGFKMKIKGEQYCKLHAVMTEFSNRDIWRCLKDGVPLEEVLGDVPDEFDAWVRGQEQMFKEMYERTYNEFIIKYNETIKPEMTRKEIAEIILKSGKRYSGVLFAIHDDKDISQYIWNMIYPEKHIKPFLIDAYE